LGQIAFLTTWEKRDVLSIAKLVSYCGLQFQFLLLTVVALTFGMTYPGSSCIWQALTKGRKYTDRERNNSDDNAPSSSSDNAFIEYLLKDDHDEGKKMLQGHSHCSSVILMVNTGGEDVSFAKVFLSQST
jgi:hypothetical protein